MKRKNRHAIAVGNLVVIVGVISADILEFEAVELVVKVNGQDVNVIVVDVCAIREVRVERSHICKLRVVRDRSDLAPVDQAPCQGVAGLKSVGSVEGKAY